MRLRIRTDDEDNIFGRALMAYDSYFELEYDLDDEHDLMPAERLTQDIVDDFLMIY